MTRAPELIVRGPNGEVTHREPLIFIQCRHIAGQNKRVTARRRAQ